MRRMSECPHLDAVIHALVTDDGDPSERRRLLQHAEKCPECRQVVTIHDELSACANRAPEPPEADFATARMNVSMRARRHPEPTNGRAFWAEARTFLRVQPVGAAALLVVLLGGALFLGRWSAEPSALSDELLLRAIHAQAEASAGVDGFWDEPLVYSNVVVKQVAGERIALSFEVSRHVDLVTTRRSAVATNVLMHAILDPSPLGKRLQAIGLTQEIMDPTLRDAVIFTLRHDPDLAVRLQAIAVLSECFFDATIQEAVLTTLSEDVSVRMRMEALELLRARHVSSELVRRAMAKAAVERGEAAYWEVSDPDHQL